MSPLVKLLLLVAVAVAVLYVVRAVRQGGLTSLSSHVRFTPVEELPHPARQAIDVHLAEGRTLQAVALYREVTGAGPTQARTAVETYRWKQGGEGG